MQESNSLRLQEKVPIHLWHGVADGPSRKYKTRRQLNLLSLTFWELSIDEMNINGNFLRYRRKFNCCVFGSLFKLIGNQIHSNRNQLEELKSRIKCVIYSER